MGASEKTGTNKQLVKLPLWAPLKGLESDQFRKRAVFLALLFQPLLLAGVWPRRGTTRREFPEARAT